MQFFSRRRQSGQIQMHPAKPDLTRSFRGRQQIMRLMLRRNEGIDRIPDPLRSSDDWNLGPHDRLIRPVPCRIFGDLFVRWETRSLIDPCLEQVDLSGRQPFAFANRRHAIGRIGGHDAINHATEGRITRNDRPPVFASPMNQRTGIKPQPGSLLQRTMAGSAFVGQQRSDLAGIVNLCRRRFVP